MTGRTFSLPEKVGAASSSSVFTGLEDTEAPEDLETGQAWSSGASSESQIRDEALGRGLVGIKPSYSTVYPLEG